MKRLLFSIALLLAVTGANAQTLDTNFCETNGAVFTIATDSSYIYIGGEFTSVCGQARNYIARIDKTTGSLDTAWNPNANGDVISIAISGSDIYVGGYYDSIGGRAKNNIAKLNNTNGNADATWNPNVNGQVASIVISGSDIYVGGSFDSIGGQAKNNIAKLNNTNGNANATWNPNADNLIHSITISGNSIYVGGEFTNIGGQARNYIAKLNNTNGNADAIWNPNIDYALYNTVRTITISGSSIYVGGEFDSIGGQARNDIAKLNNINGNIDTTWNLDINNGGYLSLVFSTAISGDDIYVGGMFDSIDGQARRGIAKLNCSNGNTDLLWNLNFNGWVWTIVINGSDMYVGGDFTYIDGQARGHIAKFTGVPDGIKEENINKTQGINIYPNPFTTSTTLKLNKPLKDATLSIYNITGSEVRRTENINGSEIVIERGTLQSGIYLIKLQTENSVYCSKIMVE